jgi:hypothetical protein
MSRQSFLALATLIAMSGCRDELSSPSEPAAAPSSGTPVASAATDSAILVVAGDVHGDTGRVVGTCGIRTKRAQATAALVRRYPQARVVPMGDNTMTGTKAEFACYDKTWGAFKSRTHPVIGNHERDRDRSAKPYYDYFNGVGADSGRAGHRARGYYSFTYGGWSILVANTNTNRTDQTAWMARVLAASPKRCTMAIWHRPLFTSSAEPPNVQTDVGISPWWRVLYDKRADLILTGHAHNYERFAKLRPDGAVDPTRGIRQFVAGTAASGLYHFRPTPRKGSEKRILTYGVLKLTLWPTRYKWEFIDTAGAVLDRGEDTCH